MLAALTCLTIHLILRYVNYYRLNILRISGNLQVCELVFEVQSKTIEHIELLRDGQGVEFLSSRVLVEYDIQLEELVTYTVNNVSRASVRFVFRRRLEFHVSNTFVQVQTTLANEGRFWARSYFADFHAHDGRVLHILF